MNIKPNKAVLALVPMIMSMSVPVFALTPDSAAVQKGAVNTVQLDKNQTLARGGQCHGGKFQGRGCGPEAKGGVQGGPKFAMHKHHRQSLIGMLHGQYALTDAQAEKVFALKGEFRTQAQPKVMDLISSERKLRDLITQPNTDKGQLLSLQTQINGDKDALGTLRLENKMQELAILTDAQKQELRREFVEHSVRRG